MNFDEYQKIAIQFDTAKLAITEKERYDGYMEKILGLAGEVIEKIKKLLRDKNDIFTLTHEEQVALKKELGDVLWYLSAIAYYNDFSLEKIATANIDKLIDRSTRDQIHGSGDNR